MSGWRATLRNSYARHFLGAELVLAICAAAAITGCTLLTSYPDTALLLQGQRSSLWATVTAVEATFLGFALATVAIILGNARSEAFATLRKSQHYGTLFKVYTSSIRWLGAATVVSLLALVLDRDEPGEPSHWLATVAGTFILIIAVRLARCFWALERVIALVTAATHDA